MRKLSFWCLALANTRLPGWGECARVRWCLISEFDGVFERRRRSAPRRLGTAEGSGERVESFPRALGRGPAVGRCGQGFARACRWMRMRLFCCCEMPCLDHAICNLAFEPCQRPSLVRTPAFSTPWGKRKALKRSGPSGARARCRQNIFPGPSSGQHPPHHYARCSHSDLFRADVWLTHRLGLGLAST